MAILTNHGQNWKWGLLQTVRQVKGASLTQVGKKRRIEAHTETTIDRHHRCGQYFFKFIFGDMLQIAGSGKIDTRTLSGAELAQRLIA
jgi:hypothetical protein